VERDVTLYNEDLAPVPEAKRTWSKWNIAALWVGMAVCIPSYMLAASLMQQGMFWWQALFTIALGNTIVLIPMLLNGHAGTKYGIPFPVLLRSSFGVRGANIPAVMRGLVACGWFGIQTWIGGSALHTVVVLLCEGAGIVPFWNEGVLPVLGISGLQFICFLFFWALNILVIVKGIECIRWLESWAAPVLLLMGVALLGWAVVQAGGFSVIFSDETVAQVRGGSGDFDFWKAFFPSLTGMVGFWATLALNIPDFTRYARSQRDQIVGQAISLPATMTLFSFIGITVTAATVVVFGEAIWDPVVLLGKFDSPIVVGISLILLIIATLSTNIAANVVSPANDFAHLMPSKISFKMGGMITGVIGVLIMPWRLVSDLGADIFTWLIGYGALLGTIAGIMLVDYYLIRRTRLDADELYERHGIYSFSRSGINWRGLVAVVIGVAPNVPGFLHAASNGAMETSPFFQQIYTYAWFVGLFVAGITHFVVNMIWPVPISKEDRMASGEGAAPLSSHTQTGALS
jgi:NCS1 family nucleobase:cation symporter-1